MRLLWFILSSVALLSVADATAGNERRSTPSGTSATILTPDFVQTVQEIVNKGGVQGLTLAIVKKTGPAELGAWGLRSENGTKMTTDTLFNLASLSKAFLSACLGIVIEDYAHGRNTTPLPTGLSTLSWKTKVADILPNDWKLMDHWASEKANLIDIHTHLSGVASNDYSFKKNDSVSDITRNLRNFRPTYELREHWLYTNQMYIVGAYVVSTLTGVRFTDFVTSRIFTPLGMSSSTYSIDAALRTGRFSETWTSFGRRIPPWIEEEYVDLVAGPAGVISSAEDMVPYINMILNGGNYPNTNSTIIPSKVFDIITTPHSIASPDADAESSTEVYGLGWGRLSYLGHDILMHDGSAPGVSTYIAVAREDGIAIAVFANTDSKDTPISDIVLAVAAKAFGPAGPSSSYLPANQSSVSRRSKPPPHADVTARADGDNAGDPLPSDVDLLTGTYYNAGYGTGVLCSVRSSSPSCKSVLAAFYAIDPSLSPKSTSPDLFASWVTPLSTHARFTYINAGQYLLSIGSIYPEGYGENITPFSTLAPAAAVEFEVEDDKIVGFGWYGNVKLKRAGTVEETSDVWFVKQA